MKLLKDNYRLWWQKPADVTKRNVNREITQLELFYDLVYVAIIIQLTHIVAGHISAHGILQYIAIFMMMLWAWFNGSLYHEFHGNNDMKTRVFTFLQMISLAGMGIFIHSAFGEGYTGFALSYTIFLALLTFLWWRTGVHDEKHKVISAPYSCMFLVCTLGFAVSVFTPAHISYFIWLGVILLGQVFSFKSMIFPNKNIDSQQLEAVQKIGHSFTERMGLLTIIILGEGVISIVGGATHITQWYPVTVLQIIGCFGILIGIWWIFFDFISRRLPKENNASRVRWMFLHFPLWISIGLVNAGILNALEYTDTLMRADRWIITFPLIVFLLACIGLGKNIQFPEIMKPLYRKGGEKMLVSVVFLLIISFLPTGKTITLWLIAGSLLLPVFSAIFVWLRWKSSEK